MTRRRPDILGNVAVDLAVSQRVGQGIGSNAPGVARHEALEDLAARYLRHAFLITGNRDTALDVVADVTLRILDRNGKTEIHDLNAYFRRSVVNRAIDLGKRRARDFGPTTVSARDELQTRDVADAAVASVLVGEALGRIAPKLRAVIVLRFFDDLSVDEIAQVLRVPTGTVKSRLSRGLDGLAQFINGRTKTAGGNRR
jgi:RNA polymerase sigma factor (sigma-70 family)